MEEERKDPALSEILDKSKKGKIEFYEWNESIEKEIEKIISEDHSKPTEFWYQKYEKDAKRNWDIFYKHNTTNFFKNRYYIDSEFTELQDLNDKYKDTQKIFCEIGCGVGNTIFPLANKYKNLMVYGFDFAPKAIELLKKNSEYNPKTMVVEVCDLVKDAIPSHFESPDFASLIFVLSAISPENHQSVVKKVYEFLKPGSVLFLRDYGRYDMAQMKLAKQKCAKLKDHFYVKSDGTRVYYFVKEELREMFISVGFKEISNDYHYRLVENKKEDLKMHRVWIQAKFQK